MNVHENARMTVHGRALLVRRICEEGWRVADAARAGGVSARTAYTWLARFRAGEAAALTDRKSTPGSCPHATPAGQVAAIEQLRRERLSGSGAVPTTASAKRTPSATPGEPHPCRARTAACSPQRRPPRHSGHKPENGSARTVTRSWRRNMPPSAR